MKANEIVYDLWKNDKLNNKTLEVSDNLIKECLIKEFSEKYENKNYEVPQNVKLPIETVVEPNRTINREFTVESTTFDDISKQFERPAFLRDDVKYSVSKPGYHIIAKNIINGNDVVIP